jgi:hypothetical protein
LFDELTKRIAAAVSIANPTTGCAGYAEGGINLMRRNRPANALGDVDGVLDDVAAGGTKGAVHEPSGGKALGFGLLDFGVVEAEMLCRVGRQPFDGRKCSYEPVGRT